MGLHFKRRISDVAAFSGLIISIKQKVLNDKGFGYRSAFVVGERVASFDSFNNGEQ